MTDPARVLVVDDEARIRELLVETLQAVGYQTAGASGGGEALDKLRAEKFDLVISDIVMPEMSGLELLNHIQKRHPGLPVVMITGSAYKGVAQAAQAAGAAGFLPKPFRISHIEDMMEETLGRKKEAAAVLVVDDDPAFLDFLGDSLKSKGYLPLKARNGREALELFGRRPARFALVDYHLPDMNAVELLDLLKQENPNLPVVLITGREVPEDAKRSGHFEIWLQKPLALPELFRAIEVLNPDSFDGQSMSS
jgi:CheY-like chemotaxis protein